MASYKNLSPTCEFPRRHVPEKLPCPMTHHRTLKSADPYGRLAVEGRSWARKPTTPGMWSGREDLNLDSFPGREACCNYTTSAKPASDEPDTFVV